MQANTLNGTTTSSTIEAPSRASSFGLILGGALMVTMYALQIVRGVQTGEVMSPANWQIIPIFWAAGLSFSAALVCIGLGLIGLGMWMRQYSPKLALIAMALPIICIISPALIILASLGGVTVPQEMTMLNGLGVIGNLASATLLGIAALRSKALPKPIGWTLTAVGLATFPLILLTIPAEQFMPGFVVMDLPFPGWGLIFMLVGASLLRLRRRP